MKFLIVLLPVLLFGCGSKPTAKNHLPGTEYHYVQLDTAALPVRHAVYVPVYSHIYLQSGRQTMGLTATVSIRNTSYMDSFYVLHITYYGSQGQVLKHYLDQPVVVRPMASVESVVEESESEGGAGAGFVIQWGARNSAAAPLVQAVMNGSATGVSFVTNGVEIK